MTKTIYFDMDGTLADFYGVDGWLDSLLAEDVRPYAEAKPLHNFSQLARLIHKVQAQGVRVGIISALSKNGSENYQADIMMTKLLWLKRHLPSVQFDEIHFCAYDAVKYDYATDKNALLFDDEVRHHEAWGGTADFPAHIVQVLKSL